jgi:hypothetical protein
LGGVRRGRATVAPDTNGSPKEKKMKILNKNKILPVLKKIKLFSQIKGN